VTRYPGPDSSTQPDPESVARTVNSAWAVTRDRLARGRVEWSAPDLPTADDMIQTLDARFERIEATLFALFQLIDEVDAVAAYCVERVEAA
jgi:hypothetical protein